MPLLPVLLPIDEENDPDVSIDVRDCKGDRGVVAVMLVDEAAESIETCRLNKLNFFLISSAILLCKLA